MDYAEEYVVWAGRYPTPKWIKESQKEKYDVPSAFVDGIEHIDARDMPNSASRGGVNELLALYDHINGAWRGLARLNAYIFWQITGQFSWATQHPAFNGTAPCRKILHSMNPPLALPRGR